VRQIGGKIDTNDLDFITERYGKPLVAQPCPISKKDGKEVINPHVSTFRMTENKGKERTHSVSVFHSKPIYYLHKNGGWRPLSEVTSYYGTKNLTLKDNWSAVIDLNYLRWLLQRVELLGGRVSIPGKSKKAVPLREGAEIFFSTSTFYPAAGTASPVCGRAYRGGVSQAWAAFRAAAGTGADHTETSTFNWGTLTSAATLDEWRAMSRSIAGFDTSTIGTDTVDSGTFSLYGSGTKLDAFEQSICLVGAEPASDNTVVAGDYVLPGNWGTTELAPRKDVSGLSTNSYEDFTLNSAGIVYIETGAITWMGGRTSADLDDVEPATHPGSQDDSLWRCYSSDESGTSKDPKLVIVHRATSTAQVLVIAGGGGGSAIANSGTGHGGGGGGAGGFVYNGSRTVAIQAYTITVGDGGAKGSSEPAGQGGDSSFDSLDDANGGGYGAGISNAATNGGSGGGATVWNTTPGTGDSGGNDGGDGGGGAWGTGGGGGGASAVGGNADGSQNAGNGGNGTANSITGSSVTYAGGGGGSGNSSAGTGGTGGGGNGGQAANGSDGTAALGGGGGGGGGGNGDGGAGGSGIVIVSYNTTEFNHTGGDATGTYGNDTWVKFTSDGTLTLLSTTAAVVRNLMTLGVGK
jgi:hypothetical protein